MKRPMILCVVVVALAWPLALLAEEATLPTTAGPSELVQAALRTELDGPSDARHALLDRALAIDPDFAPARWQSGFVRFDGQWLKVDDVPRHARGIEHLADYRKLRDGMVDTADNHRALARWCHKNKLPDEERVHWAKVLEYEHADAEALEALGLQLYNGRLLTRSQIEEEKKRAGDARRAMQRWQPQFVKWRKAFEHGTPKQLDEALRGLKDLADPAAMPALEAVFGVNADAPKQVELNKLLIETVGRMPVPEATQVLLRRAIVPDSLEVRAAACDQLKKRPTFAYVPLLIATCPEESFARAEYRISWLPGDIVLAQVELFAKQGQSEHRISSDFAINIIGGCVGKSLPTIRKHVGTDIDAELAVALKFVGRFLQAEADSRSREPQIERLRKRIQFVLQETTGFAHADDPKLWEQQWNEYNDFYAQPSTARSDTQTSESFTGWYSAVSVQRVSCFPAGTPVLTVSGAVPIEKVMIGDRVLSQDPWTGQLGYHAVQSKTLRPATPMYCIASGSHAIGVTGGHPFWVANRGWQIAKFLKSGDVLHGLDGAATIDSVEELPPVEAYNLVVSDWHTYFVGDRRLLVHDNTPLAEISVVIPGLAAADKGTPAPQDQTRK